MKSYWEHQDDMAQLREDQADVYETFVEAEADELQVHLRMAFMRACYDPLNRLLDTIEDGRKVEYPLEHFLEDWGMGAFKDNILKLFKQSSCIVAQQFKDECAKMYATDNSYPIARFNMENNV